MLFIEPSNAKTKKNTAIGRKWNSKVEPSNYAGGRSESGPSPKDTCLRCLLNLQGGAANMLNKESHYINYMFTFLTSRTYQGPLATQVLTPTSKGPWDFQNSSRLFLPFVLNALF